MLILVKKLLKIYWSAAYICKGQQFGTLGDKFAIYRFEIQGNLRKLNFCDMFPQKKNRLNLLI